MKNAPCARFGIRIRPKFNENPEDSKNSRPPKATLFSVWMIQNCPCISKLALRPACPHRSLSLFKGEGDEEVILSFRDFLPAGCRASRPDFSRTHPHYRSRIG